MKNLKRILVAFGLIISLHAFAVDRYDGEGMPIFYIYGSENGWSAQENCRFTRNGNHYSIHLDRLNGEFKITIDGWSLNYGAEGSNKFSITAPAYYKAYNNGPNFIADNITDVDIYFDYAAGRNYADICFAYNGVEPKPDALHTGTLPVLHINVYDNNGLFDNEIIDTNLSHKNYFAGEYWLELPEDPKYVRDGDKALGSADEPLPLEIKARGNWTRTAFAKKPFKIKLGAKQKMLGLTKSKHFALLAHADDNFGYLRNYVGFNLGRRIGLPWTPYQRAIEVIINGDYRGLYFLTESIRVEKDRVNITELDDNVGDGALISGGYLVELDNYYEDNQIRMAEKSCAQVPCDQLLITPDTPEEYSALQRRFVTDQFTAMNDLVGTASDALWSYMDIDDAARYYIVEEILGHTEAYHGSTYLYRDRGEGQKWHFSPLWDCGNAFNAPVNGFFYLNSLFGATWIPSMRLNGKFNDVMEATWKWFMGNRYTGINDDIDVWTESLRAAAIADHKRWKDVQPPSGGVSVYDNSDIDSKAAQVKNYLKQRTAWLAQRFGSYSSSDKEPARDTTPAAPLPDYAVSAIENVSVSSDAPIEYYNLQGMRVENPSGGIFIRRQGHKATKVAK